MLCHFPCSVARHVHMAMQHVQMCWQQPQRPLVNLPRLSGAGAAASQGPTRVAAKFDAGNWATRFAAIVCSWADVRSHWSRRIACAAGAPEPGMGTISCVLHHGTGGAGVCKEIGLQSEGTALHTALGPAALYPDAIADVFVQSTVLLSWLAG